MFVDEEHREGVSGVDRVGGWSGSAACQTPCPATVVAWLDDPSAMQVT